MFFAKQQDKPSDLRSKASERGYVPPVEIEGSTLYENNLLNAASRLVNAKTQEERADAEEVMNLFITEQVKESYLLSKNRNI